MAKATPEPDKRQDRHRFLALQEPRITVLTDHPLATGQAYRESFALDFRMGPILDIVRHPDTRTPLAVAVYGTWGAGKTKAEPAESASRRVGRPAKWPRATEQ